MKYLTHLKSLIGGTLSFVSGVASYIELSSTRVILSGGEPSPLRRVMVVLRSSILLTRRPPSTTNLLTEDPIMLLDDGGSKVLLDDG